jgi:O-antigen/teichoic acid export membrane protein
MNSGHSTLLISASQGVLAATAALYGLLIPRLFAGNPTSCDAFFAAYAVYTTVAVYSVSMRFSVPPILAGGAAGVPDAVRYRSVTRSVFRFFILIALGIVVLAHPLSSLLASGLDSTGRLLTGRLVLALAPAIFLQAMAFYFSGTLAAYGRIDFVSLTIIASSIAGCAAFVLLSGLGVISVVIGLFVFSLIWAAALWRRMRTVVPKPDNTGVGAMGFVATALTISASALPFLTLALCYTGGQAIATYCPRGAPTAFAYAYLLITTAVGMTSGSMGVGLVKRFTELRGAEREVFHDYLMGVVARASIVTSGAVGALAALAIPFGRLLFGRFLPDGTITTAETFVVCVWSLAAVGWSGGVQGVLTPVLLAVGLDRRIVLQAALLPVVSWLLCHGFQRHLGIVGVCLAMSLTYVLFSVLMLLHLRHSFCASFVTSVLRRAILPGAAAALSSVASVSVLMNPELGIPSPLDNLAGGATFLILFTLLVFVVDRRSCRELIANLRR